MSARTAAGVLVVVALASSPASAREPEMGEVEVERRADLLFQAIERWEKPSPRALALLCFALAIPMGGTGAYALAKWEERGLEWRDAPMLLGTATVLGGGVASLIVASDEDAQLAGTIAYFGGASLYFAWFAFLPHRDSPGGEPEGDGFNEVAIVSALAGLAATTVWALDEPGRRADRRRIAALRARLDTPREREQLYPADILALEREVKLLSRGRTAWGQLPLYLGAAVAVGMGIAEDDDQEQMFDYFCASVLVSIGLLQNMRTDRYARYQRWLRETGLEVGLVPTRGGAAVGVSGRF